MNWYFKTIIIHLIYPTFVKFGKDFLFAFAASHSLLATSLLVLSTPYSLFLKSTLFQNYLCADLTSLDLDIRYWKLNSRLTFKGFHSFFLILHFIFVTSRIPQLLISWQFLANVLSFLILHLFYRIQTLSASFTLSNYSHKEVLFIFYYISILVQLLVFVFQLSSLKSLFHIFMFSFSM